MFGRLIYKNFDLQYTSGFEKGAHVYPKTENIYRYTSIFCCCVFASCSTLFISINNDNEQDDFFDTFFIFEFNLLTCNLNSSTTLLLLLLLTCFSCSFSDFNFAISFSKSSTIWLAIYLLMRIYCYCYVWSKVFEKISCCVNQIN